MSPANELKIDNPTTNNNSTAKIDSDQAKATNNSHVMSSVAQEMPSNEEKLVKVDLNRIDQINKSMNVSSNSKVGEQEQNNNNNKENEETRINGNNCNNNDGKMTLNKHNSLSEGLTITAMMASLASGNSNSGLSGQKEMIENANAIINAELNSKQAG